MLLIKDRTKFATAEQNNEKGKERGCKNADKRLLLMLRDIFNFQRESTNKNTDKGELESA